MLLSSSFENFLQLIGALLIFAFVLLITYLTTKWMGGFQSTRTNNKNLKVIETISVGQNKMISLIQSGEVFLVVSIGKDEVHLLAQLTREQLTDFSFEEVTVNNTFSQESFQEIFTKLKDKLPKKQG